MLSPIPIRDNGRNLNLLNCVDNVLNKSLRVRLFM